MAWRTKLILLAGVTLVALCLTMAFAAPSTGAAATPGATAAAHRHSGGTAPATRNGDNGTVKIHRSTTPVTDPRNEPHVCVFYLDAFGFDAGQSVSWQIKSWPPTGDRTVVSSGVLALDTNGDGHTGDMTLANGHYKLYWNFTGEHGFAKQKVFWVACPAPTPTGTPTPSPSGSPTPSPSVSPTPSPSVSPTPTSTATPSPSLAPSSPPPSPPSPSGLPITGRPLGLIAAAGAALLGTGGTVMVASRRRRGLHSR